MLRNPDYRLDDVDEVRRLVRQHPWATLVTAGPDGPVASHYAVILDEDASELTLLTHLGRPDEVTLGLPERPVLVIVQGPHGYVSPSWYPQGQVIPTWNHLTAHLWCRAERLGEEENLRVLGRLVDQMEAPLADGRSLDLDPERVRAVARGTVGLRLRVERFEALHKLSQDKAEPVRRSVLAALGGDGPYAQPALAAELARTLPTEPG